jgi:hypothetical protein
MNTRPAAGRRILKQRMMKVNASSFVIQVKLIPCDSRLNFGQFLTRDHFIALRGIVNK